MKYLFERLDEQRRIPLADATWEDVKPIIDSTLPAQKWQKTTVDMPKDFMSSREFRGEIAFNNWKEDFIDEWGSEGELVEVRPTYWKIFGNSKWNEAFRQESRGVSDYYAEKKSGEFTGD